MTPFVFKSALGVLTLLLATGVHAQVKVKDPWIRGTVAQQKATGLFMSLSSAQAARLVSGRSPVAGVVEIHEMRMDGDIMRMRAIAGLDLPAGGSVEFKPGGYHLMLMDLKRPLRTGEKIPVTLVLESGGQRQELVVEAEVRPLGKAMPMGAGHDAHQGHRH